MASMVTQDPDQVDKASTPTLSAFVMKSTGDHELAILMNAISLSCKAITRAVRKAGELSPRSACMIITSSLYDTRNAMNIVDER